MKQLCRFRFISSARFAVAAAGLLMGTASARADWPLVWDLDGRDDEPVAARRGQGGDLWVLTESYLQGQGSPRAVLLRVAPDGEIVWASADPELTSPTALALRDDGSALAIGRIGTELRVTAFTAAGAIAWSRSRASVAADESLNDLYAAPIWDATAAGAGGSGAWRIPCGLAGDFAVLSFTAEGDPLPDVVWSPPSGGGRATSLLPRTGGGLLVAGLTESLSPPGWWTVALDAAGAEVWKHFDDGGTPAGVFSGAFLLSADPVRVWADDETFCGLFSLRLWALDAATGAPLWDATWPPNGSPACNSFIVDSVLLEGDRIVASGVGDVASVGASFDPLASTFDAATGAHQWTQVFSGATTGIRAEVASVGGSALLASTLFPDPNPGPTPLWLAAWDRDGDACGAPLESCRRGSTPLSRCRRRRHSRDAAGRLRLQLRRGDPRRSHRAASRRPLRRPLPGRLRERQHRTVVVHSALMGRRAGRWMHVDLVRKT